MDQLKHSDHETPIDQHRVTSRDEWIVARKALLAREKMHTRAGDELSRQRRALPWVKVDTDYQFDTPAGRKSLGDLFDGRSQLIVYHFMYGPGWEEGCVGCSFLADHMDGANLHLSHHDVKLVAVSRAPLAEFLPFKRRMGWMFDWVSSAGSDFNFDYQVSATADELEAGKTYYNYEMADGAPGGELPGISVFYKNPAGDIFHTYSSYARGGDILIGTHNYLDLTPKGRNEGPIMNWVRHHNRYEDAPSKTSAAETPMPIGSCCG
jgi:predicted dithiol-disulfide oxidoreductase (DUF899 family)